MAEQMTPELVTLPIGEIKPYENNPRRIPDSAVRAVRESIEKYGYSQPIVVDTNNVVVVGHTRLKAIQSMGVEEVEVYRTILSPEKAREYRLVDNRTSEYGKWDHDALVSELREMEQGLVEAYFPEVDLEIQSLEDALVTQEDVDKAAKEATKIKEPESVVTTSVECPSCFETFQVRTRSLPFMNNEDEQELLNDGEAV